MALHGRGKRRRDLDRRRFDPWALEPVRSLIPSSPLESDLRDLLEVDPAIPNELGLGLLGFLGAFFGQEPCLDTAVARESVRTEAASPRVLRFGEVVIDRIRYGIGKADR